MKIRIAIVASMLAVLISGCNTLSHTPVPIDTASLGSQMGRVGVAMTKLPKVDVSLTGASCLLCMAVASAANSTLTTYAQTLPYDDLPKLKDMLAEQLRKKGSNVIIIDEDIDVKALDNVKSETPNAARKNFSPLQKKYNIDRLTVISIGSLGFVRTYSSYFPTSDPKATIERTGFLVNLATNTYEWFLPVNVTRSADKNWDEPPKFPGLTNAYFQIIELGKDAFLKPFTP